jgi:hypothetical protein
MQPPCDLWIIVHSRHALTSQHGISHPSRATSGFLPVQPVLVEGTLCDIAPWQRLSIPGASNLEAVELAAESVCAGRGNTRTRHSFEAFCRERRV